MKDGEAVIPVIVGKVVLKYHVLGGIDRKPKHAIAMRFIAANDTGVTSLKCDPSHPVVVCYIVGYIDISATQNQNAVRVVSNESVSGQGKARAPDNIKTNTAVAHSISLINTPSLQLPSIQTDLVGIDGASFNVNL